MNTILEVANEEQLLSNDIKASVTTKSSNITMSTSSNNNIHSNQTQPTNTNINNNSNNNNSSNNSTNQASASANGVAATEDLKIIGHLKNIEKINEKRRIFLTNTISEYSTEEKIETKTSSNSNTNGQPNNGLNGAAAENNNNVLHTIEELRTHHISEQHFDKASSNNTSDNNNSDSPVNASSSITTKYTTATSTLKSPTSPPPKPPMLSRAKSLTSPPQSPAFTQKSPIKNPYTAATVFNMPAAAVATPITTPTPAPAPPATETTTPTNANEAAVNANVAITTATITTTVVPETVKVTTIQLKDKEFDTETPLLRHAVPPTMHERPTSASPAQALKQISVNHYQRLIEELRCPGCASPMKAPILLCKSGHSVCEQCTRILLMCPLCKEPFTSMRSLTVEALCRKAHFRCANASSGCTVRLQIDLLTWHQRQCIYKPMKCFMGRVWGDCEWTGREVDWKEHLETEHANKVYCMDTVDLIWNMGIKQKPLTGYYVFQAFGEMFNFYEVFDKERVLFTMACTSTIKEKKLNYAFEVTMIHQDNEALAITQKFPVHSEYDSDILAEGSCVSISLADLAKFIDEERLLHYRVRILEVKTTPRKFKTTRHSMPNMHPIDFQQTQIEGVNLKNVPAEVIVTRKQQLQTDMGVKRSSTHSLVDAADAASSDEDEIDKIRRLYNEKCTSSPNDSCSESDPEFEAFIAKRWGTPQLHFKRKYLKTDSNNGSTSPDDDISRADDVLGKMDRKFQADDKASICSTNTSYKKRMSNTLRRSFRTLKTEVIEMNPFGKKSPEKKKPIVE